MYHNSGGLFILAMLFFVFMIFITAHSSSGIQLKFDAYFVSVFSLGSILLILIKTYPSDYQ
jgi:hypothetical protein